MNSELKLRLKMAYGQNRFYPDCPLSLNLSELVGCASFTEAQLRSLMNIGFILNIGSEHNEELHRIQETFKQPSLVAGKGRL